MLGIVSAVIGIGLLVWGYQLSDSFGNQVAESLTGSSFDAVMYKYVSGAAIFFAGVCLFLRKG